jgi:GNAT superfamily N-acetyltransferase
MNQLRFVHKTSIEISIEEKLRLIQIWNQEYPIKLHYESSSALESYLETIQHGNHILVFDSQSKLIAWAADFIRDNEKWFLIIVDSTCQLQGLGTKLINALKEKNALLNGWAIDHNTDLKSDQTFYKSPLQFYLKNGFEIITDQRMNNEKISAVKIRWHQKIGQH